MSSIQVPPQLWMMMTLARSHSHAASAIIAAGLDGVEQVTQALSQPSQVLTR